jgi:hypothetical protein
MFNAQMMNVLIQQDDNNRLGMEIFAVIIMTSLNVAHIFGFIYGSYKVDSFLGISQTLKFVTNYIWNLLTPGYQWLEILFIFSAFALLLLGKLILDEITTKINNSFTNLKEQLKIKENRIVELEAELKRLQYSSLLYEDNEMINLKSADL